MHLARGVSASDQGTAYVQTQRPLPEAGCDFKQTIRWPSCVQKYQGSPLSGSLIDGWVKSEEAMGLETHWLLLEKHYND